MSALHGINAGKGMANVNYSPGIFSAYTYSVPQFALKFQSALKFYITNCYIYFFQSLWGAGWDERYPRESN